MGSANFSLVEFARAANSEVVVRVPVHGSAQPFTLHVTHRVDFCSIVGGCLIAWNFSSVKGGHDCFFKMTGFFFIVFNLISFP